MPKLHEAARWYAERGIPVFPLTPTSKIPLKGSNGVKDATTDLAQIDAWWKATPDANIGGATGFAFDVLDVDEGGEESLLMYDAIPRTPETITASGGTHLFFKPSPIPLKNAVAVAPGLDVRTKGGYVVLPPSVNCESGWKWKVRLDKQELADCPAWIVEALKREPEEKSPAIPSVQVKEGTRNDSLFRYACRLRRNGLDELEIMGALMVVNRTRCKPPLSDQDLATIAMSAAKYRPEPNDLPQTEVEIPEEARSGWIGEFQTDGEKTGVPSGFAFVDDNTQSGGFYDSQMTVISAYTGVGKTTIMCQCALNIARRGETVGFVTYADLSAGDIYDKLVTQICGWKGAKPPESEEMYRLWDAAREEVKALPILIYDASELKHGRYVERFVDWFWKQPHMRICFNDYAQEMQSANLRHASEREHANECCGILRWLAAQSRIPIVVGSQITEGNEKQGTRDITKGSRVWEERAAMHWIIRWITGKELDNLDYELKTIPGITEFRMAKNRFGKSRGLVAHAQFDESHLRYLEL